MSVTTPTHSQSSHLPPLAHPLSPTPGIRSSPRLHRTPDTKQDSPRKRAKSRVAPSPRMMTRAASRVHEGVDESTLLDIPGHSGSNGNNAGAGNGIGDLGFSPSTMFATSPIVPTQSGAASAVVEGEGSGEVDLEQLLNSFTNVPEGELDLAGLFNMGEGEIGQDLTDFLAAWEAQAQTQGAAEADP
ncbi:hypothetical protein TREMEDRAFT_56108 [Tremella mesenterica DSM 1558]|uniref:uncharacterized protein n=1 Tax=Tremella mesenterica (strain ATCC 24925 / CBS 8224 / DSM 1558 / NBRC 9311 / NRRL Y-6157 / RJB 2259-6 / UBC 559-6) TaxID=578456 RepID=UPI0003F4A5DC|nr:uncharacterized protein TREMEDRAFT_56108 [Tremella mesenterica DSM 1558]EIW73031.1 hypothetical protein TREMEDRAFT_56108 [Tremella mesenterica DSM 1558]